MDNSYEVTIGRALQPFPRSKPLGRVSPLGQVYQPLSPVVSNDASNTGFSRQHKAQDWSFSRLWLAVAERLSAGESPQRVALVDACCVVLVPLSKDGSWSNLSSC